MNANDANPRSQVALGNGQSSHRNSIDCLLHIVLRSLDEKGTPRLVTNGCETNQSAHPVAESRAEYDFRYLHDSNVEVLVPSTCFVG